MKLKRNGEFYEKKTKYTSRSNYIGYTRNSTYYYNDDNTEKRLMLHTISHVRHVMELENVQEIQ